MLLHQKCPLSIMQMKKVNFKIEFNDKAYYYNKGQTEDRDDK